jgi:hypothetical protein
MFNANLRSDLSITSKYLSVVINFVRNDFLSDVVAGIERNVKIKDPTERAAEIDRRSHNAALEWVEEI